MEVGAQAAWIAWAMPVGRTLFVSYFIAMGMSHLLNFTEHSSVLRRKRVPLPSAALVFAIIA